MLLCINWRESSSNKVTFEQRLGRSEIILSQLYLCLHQARHKSVTHGLGGDPVHGAIPYFLTSPRSRLPDGS